MSGILGDRGQLASRAPFVGIVRRFWVAALAVTALAACSTTTSPDQRPSEAEIRVSGSSSVPLRLIVSTEFFETFDPVDQVREQVFVSADTIFIDELPHLERVTLGSTSSIVVDVSNAADEPATVRLVVELDGNQAPYDREAVMSQGGSLRYVYNWVAPEL